MQWRWLSLIGSRNLNIDRETKTLFNSKTSSKSWFTIRNQLSKELEIRITGWKHIARKWYLKEEIILMIKNHKLDDFTEEILSLTLLKSEIYSIVY